ncbi:MAG: hypothetical protein U5K00_16535 [Melioribacteraceae bacterium]|nr:hypothetical protein [Melioribacteraceae bacterium]
MVNNEPNVEIIIIFPANLILPRIPAAITKLAIAVGHANTIKIIPRSSPVMPK